MLGNIENHASTELLRNRFATKPTKWGQIAILSSGYPCIVPIKQWKKLEFFPIRQNARMDGKDEFRDKLTFDKFPAILSGIRIGIYSL